MQRFKVYQANWACGNKIEIRFYDDKGGLEWGGNVVDGSGVINNGDRVFLSWTNFLELRRTLNAIYRDSKK